VSNDNIRGVTPAAHSGGRECCVDCGRSRQMQKSYSYRSVSRQRSRNTQLYSSRY
jgi:hypothetical protein